MLISVLRPIKVFVMMVRKNDSAFVRPEKVAKPRKSPDPGSALYRPVRRNAKTHAGKFSEFLMFFPAAYSSFIFDVFGCLGSLATLTALTAH